MLYRYQLAKVDVRLWDKEPLRDTILVLMEEPQGHLVVRLFGDRHERIDV